MTISAMLLIGKDRDYEEYCRKSIENIVDEIVEYDIHEDIPDFSEMRNSCLERAKGDWILYIDIDEILANSDGSPVKRKQLDKLIEDANFNGTVGYSPFTIHFLYNYRMADGRNNGQHFSHCRFFKKDAVLKYEGKIHEMPILKYGQIKGGMGSIFLWHFGHCMGIEKIRKTYKRAMKVEGNPFSPLFDKCKDADEYCRSHDLFRMTRPVIIYSGPLPKVLKLW